MNFKTLAGLLAIATTVMLSACNDQPMVDNNVKPGNAEMDAAEFEQAMLRDLGGLPGFGDKMVEVGDRVYFATDKYNLNDEGQATLQRQASLLKLFPSVTVTVEGYCDERGTREYNLALGARRANTARNYLIALGVSGERIGVISFGKDVTLVPGSTPEAWAQNRVAVTAANM